MNSLLLYLIRVIGSIVILDMYNDYFTLMFAHLTADQFLP